MPDFMNNNLPLEMVKIDKDNLSEMDFWSKQLKCELDELISAIDEVGNSVQDIRYYFRTVQAD